MYNGCMAEGTMVLVPDIVQCYCRITNSHFLKFIIILDETLIIYILYTQHCAVLQIDNYDVCFCSTHYWDFNSGHAHGERKTMLQLLRMLGKLMHAHAR